MKLRKITRKKINEIQKLEVEIKDMKKSKIEMIEGKCLKLLGSSNMGKEIEIEEIKEIEIKLEKLKIPKTIFNTIKKYLYQRNTCITFYDIENIVLNGRLKSW